MYAYIFKVSNDLDTSILPSPPSNSSKTNNDGGEAELQPEESMMYQD